MFLNLYGVCIVRDYLRLAGARAHAETPSAKIKYSSHVSQSPVCGDEALFASLTGVIIVYIESLQGLKNQVLYSCTLWGNHRMKVYGGI